MNKQIKHYIALFFIFLLLSLLIWTNFNSQISTLKSESALNVLLLELHKQDSDISQLILKSHSNLNPNFDELASAQKTLTEQISRLKVLLNSPEIKNLNDSISNDNLYSLYNKRLNQIEKFKSLHANVNNSLRYLPKLEQQIRNKLDNQESSLLIQTVDNIVINALGLKIFTEASIAQKNNRTLVSLEKMIADTNEESSELISLFIWHAYKYQDLRKEMNLLIPQLINNPLATELDKLEKAIGKLQFDKIYETKKMRFYILIYAGLLSVIVVAFLINRRYLINNVLRHKKLSERDQLTNLNNRRSFIFNLELALKNVTKHNSHGAIIFIDLDGFKAINDTLGHQAGDKVLITIAERLSGIENKFSKSPLELNIARLGGDEFVILVELNCPDFDKNIIEQVAQEVVMQCALPLPDELSNADLSASVGICVFPKQGTDITLLLNNADKAMYHSKRKGKNCYTFYQDN
jgi:diguanylate cyclase (GGDEF)-like protein